MRKVSDNKVIYLHENGITIVAKPGAKGAKAGETYERPVLLEYTGRRSIYLRLGRSLKSV
ncbi:hypothetical protein N9H28_04370 [Flavobacteriaceae bacterium]|nr:hypothetical protein [Flavobacteriaceae bacterium]